MVAAVVVAVVVTWHGGGKVSGNSGCNVGGSSGGSGAMGTTAWAMVTKVAGKQWEQW